MGVGSLAVLLGAALTLPPPDGAVDYQLGGAYPPPDRVTIVARDSSASPVAGIYSICYVNGFQTQPDEYPWWSERHPDAILHDASGAPMADPAWPDEYALDARTDASREAVVAGIGPVIDRCAAAGFDAVEFDNLDSWTRFDGLTREGNLLLAKALIERAHGLGLAVGQKNAPDLGASGPEAGFDFVISEDCARWHECGLYAEHYGDRHIDIEYEGHMPDGQTFDALCELPDLPALTVLRDRDLGTPDSAGYVFALCPSGP